MVFPAFTGLGASSPLAACFEEGVKKCSLQTNVGIAFFDSPWLLRTSKNVSCLFEAPPAHFVNLDTEGVKMWNLIGFRGVRVHKRTEQKTWRVYEDILGCAFFPKLLQRPTWLILWRKAAEGRRMQFSLYLSNFKRPHHSQLTFSRRGVKIAINR